MKLRGGSNVKSDNVKYFLMLLLLILIANLIVLLVGVTFATSDSKNLACGFVGASIAVVLMYLFYLNFSGTSENNY